MFADVFGRIQQWSGLVQNKLDICKEELEALRKELIARACEIDNLRKLLAECEEREKAIATTQTVQMRTAMHLPMQDEVKIADELFIMDESIVEEAKKEEIPIEDDDDEEHIASTTYESQQLEILCTDAAIQAIMKDRDRIRQEMELEAEIARLRKENQRIIKERAEYENAIQRALLRGVSSLNVEALRVLRCPPIPCCSPCAPCPASAMDSIVPCKKDDPSALMAKSCVTQRSGHGKNASREQGCRTLKRPCASPCCPAGKGRKSVSNNSLVFLLHQEDTGNVCTSNNTVMPRVCGAPAVKKIEIPPCPRFNI
ncbi:unnamed protein product [Xylocopa violacea]|uniref:Uncharacterized protein n=1 Tax=Xylocopa violacea TaxID=135666 RepID=A0ABP1N6D9_XYLVO